MKKNAKSLLCLLVTFAAALLILPDAFAATTISASATTWSSGEYVLNGDVTIPSRIEVSGNVTLTLTRGTLTAPKGIHVAEGNGLTINGTSGALLINGLGDDDGDFIAGIGGDDTEACGAIVINGGTITVTGGFGGAGIGNGQTVSSGGSITINGGTVNATGGGGAAGIGGGQNVLLLLGSSHSGPSVTITGGNVTAQGGTYINRARAMRAVSAAGIGGGEGGSGGRITITGGTVNATGSESGAGIGGGGSTAWSNSTTRIQISGTANVTAQGGDGGAGIGSSEGGIGSVEISGGTVNATGGAGAAGIGNGKDNFAGSSTNRIAISGGNVTAQGGAGAAGISSGSGSERRASVTITGGNITATAGSGATAAVSGSNVSVEGVSAEELASGTVTVGGANNGSGSGSSGNAIANGGLPDTAFEDSRTLYAWICAASLLCAAGAYAFRRRVSL